MTPKTKIDNLLRHIGVSERDGFTFDEEKTVLEMERHHAAYSNVIIKILSIIGGVLATAALIGFLFLAGLYESESSILVTGLIFVISSIFASRFIDHVFLDTTVITFYITGILLTCFGMESLQSTLSTTLLLIACLSIVGVFASRGFMMAFTSVIAFNTTLVVLVMEYAQAISVLPTMIMGVILFLITNMESKFITQNKTLNRLFLPLQAGYFISFLCSISWLIFSNELGATMFVRNQFALSLCIDISILLIITKIIRDVNLNSNKHIVLVYISTIAILACVFFAPYISGAFFLLLLAYYYGYKAEVVISFVALLLFVIKFYYDLQLTLLVKSGLLFAPGILMIGLWFYLTKQMKNNEEI